jgi:fatty-acyl-CoA synthase
MSQPFAHHRFWPKGVPHTVRIPQVGLPHFLAVNAARYPDKAAIIFNSEVLTYGQLHQRVEALAVYLASVLGVQPGDRVLLLSQNCPQFVIAYYATLRVRAAVVPVNPMSTTAEIRYTLADSGAQVALVASELLPQIAPFRNATDGESLDAVVVHTYSGAVPLPSALPLSPTGLATLHDFDAACAVDVSGAQALPQPLPQPQSNDLAVIPYTSGTTGHPKGCMHTHATVLASCMASQLWRGFTVESVFLCVAPLFHMLGMQNGMNLPMTLGATVVMMPRWNPVAAAALIERHRITVWTAPPAMVIDFFAQPQALAHDLSSLSTLSGGGAAMPEAVATMLSERFGLSYNEAYGLSETAAFLHANPIARGKRQCLGMPTQSVESRIIDPVTLLELPQGEVGELVTHGPQVMTGYWRNDEANASAFILLEGKRFFRTGDLASIDSEGYFFMRDRLKRMINASGYKVWPAEVESALYEHPAIHEACVIAIDDAKRFESVKALVVLKPSHRGQVSADDIVAWGRERMAVYKAPRVVALVEQLPKSSTGKILWRELQEAERKASAPDNPLSDNPVTESV